jgi:hypothetical protein
MRSGRIDMRRRTDEKTGKKRSKEESTMGDAWEYTGGRGDKVGQPCAHCGVARADEAGRRAEGAAHTVDAAGDMNADARRDEVYYRDC